MVVNCEDLKCGDIIIFRHRAYCVLGFNYGWRCGHHQVLYVKRMWFKRWIGRRLMRILLDSAKNTYFEVIN